MQKLTLEQIKSYYCEVFFIEDDTILDLLCAIAISSWTKSDAIWLLIVGAPSSGKSEYVNSLGGLSFAHQVSTLTENALLSAMPGSDGKEKSLLHRMGNNALMLMKDYTSILSLKEELRKKILGDLREIYDGHLKKETGTGKVLEWGPGFKLNFIGAVTDAVYLGEGDDASMGRRTLSWIMPRLTHETRIKMAKRSSQNISGAQIKRDKIKELFAEFIEIKKLELPDDLDPLPEDLIDELITVADFSTKMRTATARTFQGDLCFTPEAEAPMRMANQLMIMAQILIFLNDGVLKQSHHDILCKIALDSIPRQRMVALEVLARYEAVDTKGLAQELNYPTKTVLKWLEDINVLKGCSRFLSGSRDMWKLNQRDREIMVKYGHIEYIGNELLGNDAGGGYYDDGGSIENMDAGTLAEAERAIQRGFEELY